MLILIIFQKIVIQYPLRSYDCSFSKIGKRTVTKQRIVIQRIAYTLLCNTYIQEQLTSKKRRIFVYSVITGSGNAKYLGWMNLYLNKPGRIRRIILRKFQNVNSFGVRMNNYFEVNLTKYIILL